MFKSYINSIFLSSLSLNTRKSNVLGLNEEFFLSPFPLVNISLLAKIEKYPPFCLTYPIDQVCPPYHSSIG